jgi:hypothetical protein
MTLCHELLEQHPASQCFALYRPHAYAPEGQQLRTHHPRGQPEGWDPQPGESSPPFKPRESAPGPRWSLWKL